MGGRFDFWLATYRCRAVDPVAFPRGTSGNKLRGSFGRILKTCHPDHYGHIFAPRSSGPGGLADAPRPFVLRVSHLEGMAFGPGSQFEYRVSIFDEGKVPLFEEIFKQMALKGIGPERSRAELLSTRVDPVQLSLGIAGPPVTRLRLKFLTPTELKSAGIVVPRPEFPVLFRRIRDRISTVRALYGAGPLDIDFRALGERAEQIRMTRCQIRRVHAERRSGTTGQVHSIGGFWGDAEYEGELTEFVPYLEAAQWTGVGRQTVWGKGEIAVERLPQLI